MYIYIYISLYIFHSRDCRKKLNKLKTTKSAAPDGFHPRFLSELAKPVKSPLSIIFTKSYDENCLPNAWKDAHITAIHKKGKTVIVGNYRPVSLTSIRVQITYIFIGQTRLVFGKCVCTCVTKHSNAFQTFLNWLNNSKRVLHEPKLHISHLPLFANFDL